MSTPTNLKYYVNGDQLVREANEISNQSGMKYRPIYKYVIVVNKEIVGSRISRREARAKARYERAVGSPKSTAIFYRSVKPDSCTGELNIQWVHVR